MRIWFMLKKYEVFKQAKKMHRFKDINFFRDESIS